MDYLDGVVFDEHDLEALGADIFLSDGMIDIEFPLGLFVADDDDDADEEGGGGQGDGGSEDDEIDE